MAPQLFVQTVIEANSKETLLCLSEENPVVTGGFPHKGPVMQELFPCHDIMCDHTWTEFYTKGRPLVKSNLICPSDKLSWQPGCPVLNINIQGNFCIRQGNGSSDNLPENLV